MKQRFIFGIDLEMVFREDQARIARERAEQMRRGAAKPVPEPSLPIQPQFGITTLDDHCVQDNKGQSVANTQNAWISYWNAITDGRIFPSAANFYQAFKQLKIAEEKGTVQEKAQAHTLAESLRKDFKEYWIVTSTRILYQPPSLDAEIIQHYGNPALQTKKKLDIPEWLGIPITEALKDKNCLPYLQALFGTTDTQEMIVSTLEYISDKQRSNIKLLTPPFAEGTGYATREDYPERAVRFNLGSDEFHVSGDGHVDVINGRSRGVRL